MSTIRDPASLWSQPLLGWYGVDLSWNENFAISPKIGDGDSKSFQQVCDLIINNDTPVLNETTQEDTVYSKVELQKPLLHPA